MAPLLPTHKYRLDVTPGDAASPGVRSAPFFGSQPLETLEAGTPDTVSFTTQRLRDRIDYPRAQGNMRLRVRHLSQLLYMSLKRGSEVDVACVHLSPACSIAGKAVSLPSGSARLCHVPALCKRVLTDVVSAVLLPRHELS